MPETPGGIVRLNWAALVAEAIRRRKAEKLTQKEHAALASVSAPTIIAFDRGERTLSLHKAIDILRVVGLVEETPDAETQESFVEAALARWRDLTAGLPQNSPGRFPDGYCRIDYALEGDITEIALHKLPAVLRQAEAPYAIWPMFRLPRRAELAVQEIDGVIECWLPPHEEVGGVDRPFTSGPHQCDFWRAAPSGRLFLIRGHQEDGLETAPSGAIFDTTLPIWRIGEAFLHAAKLARLIAQNPTETTIRLRVLYTGLRGRELRAWASPRSDDYFGSGRARSDEASLEGTARVEEVISNLGRHVFPLVTSLFERFGVSGFSPAYVDAELKRMRQKNFGDNTALGNG